MFSLFSEGPLIIIGFAALLGAAVIVFGVVWHYGRKRYKKDHRQETSDGFFGSSRAEPRPRSFPSIGKRLPRTR